MIVHTCSRNEHYTGRCLQSLHHAQCSLTREENENENRIHVHVHVHAIVHDCTDKWNQDRAVHCTERQYLYFNNNNDKGMGAER